jgi:hypothetical protein
VNTLVQDGPKISSIGQVIDRWITRASPWAMAALLGVACFWALEHQHLLSCVAHELDVAAALLDLVRTLTDLRFVIHHFRQH